MEDGPRLKEALGRPEELLHQKKPLVLQGQLRRGKVGIGLQYPLPIITGLLLHLLWIDLERSPPCL